MNAWRRLQTCVDLQTCVEWAEKMTAVAALVEIEARELKEGRIDGRIVLQF